MDEPAKAFDELVSGDPNVMGGAAVFAGTRVPVQTLLDHLDAGEFIADFLVGFPSVRRQQVINFLAVHQEEVDAAWSDEIRRRLERLDSGTATTISWEEARRRIRIAAGLDEEGDRGHRDDAG
jgi:putative addiction module component (TIGR02574 family)